MPTGAHFKCETFVSPLAQNVKLKRFGNNICQGCPKTVTFSLIIKRLWLVYCSFECIFSPSQFVMFFEKMKRVDQLPAPLFLPPSLRPAPVSPPLPAEEVKFKTLIQFISSRGKWSSSTLPGHFCFDFKREPLETVNHFYF